MGLISLAFWMNRRLFQTQVHREGGSPESLENTGFLLEFIPVKTGAGMTGKYD